MYYSPHKTAYNEAVDKSLRCLKGIFGRLVTVSSQSTLFYDWPKQMRGPDIQDEDKTQNDTDHTQEEENEWKK